jgi:hypothetical protein
LQRQRRGLDSNKHDFRFLDCGLQTADSAALSRTGNYTAIQRLVSRQDAICRELFERAIATAFTQFARKVRRFDQRIQANRSRGYIAEWI